MQGYIKRNIESHLEKYLSIFPIVGILGPRQSGKSTLIKNYINNTKTAIYLDLQYPDDFNKLTNPTLFFNENEDKMICLDEIQIVPQLFSTLRSIVDKNRSNGKFILLGSASRALIQNSSESLAGRIGFLYLMPFSAIELSEMEDFKINKLWVRGGFPESYLAKNDEFSKIWIENYIKTYVERDIPQLGFQVPTMQFIRFFSILAHVHGRLLNQSKLAEAIGMTHPTIKRYIDLLEQTFIVRTIQPFESNLKKRLVKSPKVYIRDTGILHHLLRINSMNDLLSHPVLGSSWEGFVIENIMNTFTDFDYFFYRTAAGAEIDLIMKKGEILIAVECKTSTSPKPGKGLWQAMEDVNPNQTYIIAPVNEIYSLDEKIKVIGLMAFLNLKL
jgi:predicted AAA+ superfamily ATPase